MLLPHHCLKNYASPSFPRHHHPLPPLPALIQDKCGHISSYLSTTAAHISLPMLVQDKRGLVSPCLILFPYHHHQPSLPILVQDEYRHISFCLPTATYISLPMLIQDKCDLVLSCLIFPPPLSYICPHSYKISISLPLPLLLPTIISVHACIRQVWAYPSPTVFTYSSLSMLIQDKCGLVPSYHTATATHHLCLYSFKMSTGLSFLLSPPMLVQDECRPILSCLYY